MPYKVRRKKRLTSRIYLQITEGMPEISIQLKPSISNQVKRQQDMIKDMKEHEPELEKLNKEVTKHRKVKEKIHK